MIETVPISIKEIEIEKEPESIRDQGIKYGNPNNHVFYHPDIKRLTSNIGMLNDKLLEVMPPLLIKKDKGWYSNYFEAKDAEVRIELLRFACIKKVLEKEKKSRKRAVNSDENETIEEADEEGATKSQGSAKEKGKYRNYRRLKSRRRIKEWRRRREWKSSSSTITDS